MTTEQIMNIALEMAGLTEIPHDSQIYVHGENIKKVLLTIDADTGILKTAKEMGFDAVIAHHPAGMSATVELYRVIERQIETMMEHGVPLEEAKIAIKKRQEEMLYRAHMSNWKHLIDFAKLLNIPFMNVHYPCDFMMEKLVEEHLRGKISKIEDLKVEELINVLCEMPEYGNAVTKPLVAVGNPGNIVGKLCVAFAGGTNGGANVIKSYWKNGVDTVMVLHMNLSDVYELRRESAPKNLIIAGHIASDSVGLNEFARILESKGLEVVKLGIVE
ncbi:MAG: hypothetical protein PWQ20_798 [Thermotogaceae bacterium]|nr:hypothetical protein [Thermotogaceae bacterium]MDN5337728.1 hypothetical protein [Thermotogaceae bacterium]